MTASSSQQDEMRRQLNNAYIESKLSGILEPMVGQMLKDQPPNYVSGARIFYWKKKHKVQGSNKSCNI